MDITKEIMLQVIFSVLFGFSLSTGYKFQLVINETGRFIYTDHSNPNRDRYCSNCPEQSLQFQALIERDQESQCVLKFTRENDPAPEKHYFCKEHVGVVPGCGPLPKSDNLTWMTKSGGKASIDSRVYEVYFPKCPQTYVPSMNTSQFRCGEQLIWIDNPTGIQCIQKGCGPLPKYKNITWLNKSGLEVKNTNYSEENVIYVPKCPPNHIISQNITSFHCQDNLQWKNQFGHLDCISEETEIQNVWIILGLSCTVIIILLLVAVVVFMKKIRYRSTSQDSLCPLS